MYKRKQTYKKRQSRANPYFRATGGKNTTRKILYSASTVVILSLLLYAFVYGAFVRLQFGEVTGGIDDTNQKVGEYVTQLLSEKSLFVIPRNHKWIFSEDKTSEDLVERFPLNDVQISRVHGLVNISIVEKVSTYYLLKDDTLFAVDRFGVVLGQVDDLERIRVEVSIQNGATPPLIRDNRTAKLGEGSTALSPIWLEDIVRLFDKIQTRTMLTPISANLSDEEGRIDVETDAGVSLFFTLNRPIDSQVDKLESLIDRKLVEITELSYIDLRFTNRLFYH